MGALSVQPLSFPHLHHHQIPFSPKPISFIPPISHLSCKSFATQSNNTNNKNKSNESNESLFLDEDGSVVEDMDGYLSSLSLEYDSVWDTKPSWCQPWTILLTGVTVVTCSWLFLHSAIISAGALFIISAWWYVFLYAYPKVYSEMIAEREKKVTAGIEDAFGYRKSQ